MHLPTFLFLLGVTVSSCATTTTTTTTTEETPLPEVKYEYVRCRYWCIYRRPYCCDDGTLTMPPDHEPHSHLVCPPEEDHICKSSGIYLSSNTSMILAKGHPKKQELCASDGYCKENERCCPSPCVRRHLCLVGLEKETIVQEDYQPDDLEMEEEEKYLAEE